MKSQVEGMLGDVDFPVKRTIVAQNVWCEEGEDLNKIASAIVNKGLKLPRIKIKNVMRKSGWESGSGLLKIELESESDVKEILKNKKMLKDVPVPEIRDVFLRQSKKEEVLLMERNQDFILRELGKRDDYVRLPSGHLVKRDPQHGVEYRRRYSRGGHGIGRSRGGWHGRGDQTRRPAGRKEAEATGDAENREQTNTMNKHVNDITLSEYLR